MNYVIACFTAEDETRYLGANGSWYKVDDILSDPPYKSVGLLGFYSLSQAKAIVEGMSYLPMKKQFTFVVVNCKNGDNEEEV